MIILFVEVDHAVAPPPPLPEISDCQLGNPPDNFKTRPSVDFGSFARFPFASAYRTSPDIYDVRPVPPYTTPIDVVADTTPLFACRGPFRRPRFNVPIFASVDDEVTNEEYIVDEE